MFVVVCYDVPENRRRTRMSSILKGFGSRVQRSVFECDISPKHFEKLQRKLMKVLTEEDGLRYYVLCGDCVKKIEVARGTPVTCPSTFYVV
jgi:CRISPR-associated protein Cas2